MEITYHWEGDYLIPANEAIVKKLLTETLINHSEHLLGHDCCK